ncbi:hypothetical protein RIF29_20515 [Crotalaria pallida]|uniref:VQ domain-containing protein n=1 Tax=Crotalaria pallida TaxID=3830 RepID=A0AAN9ICG9_CROPI
MLGANNNHVMKRKGQDKRNKKDIKVTYIPSPMKFKTSASNFRALVQELTGQDSCVAETFMEPGDVIGVVHNNKGLAQQWSNEVDEGHLLDPTWLKPDNNVLASRSSMEPLKEDVLYDLLSFDML